MAKVVRHVQIQDKENTGLGTGRSHATGQSHNSKEQRSADGQNKLEKKANAKPNKETPTGAGRGGAANANSNAPGAATTPAPRKHLHLAQPPMYHAPVPFKHSFEKLPADLTSISIRGFGPPRTTVGLVPVSSAPPQSQSHMSTRTHPTPDAAAVPTKLAEMNHPLTYLHTRTNNFRPPLYAVGWGWNSQNRAGNITVESQSIPRQVLLFAS